MAAHSAIAFVEKFKCLVKLTLLIIFYTIARSIIGVIRRVIDDSRKRLSPHLDDAARVPLKWCQWS